MGSWCQSWSGGSRLAECDAMGDDRGPPGGGASGPGRVWVNRLQALLVDGPVDLFRHSDALRPATVRPIVDGDAKCASVAAASVLAKVIRDRLMRRRRRTTSRLRLRTEQGLSLSGSTRRRARVRALGDPPPELGLRPGLPWCGQGRERDTIRRRWRPRAKWQATGCPCPRSTSAGSSVAQISWAFQHRVRKRQPLGRLTRARHVTLEDDVLSGPLGSGVGDGHGGQQRLGVGVRGALVDVLSRSPISTILPRYMTATRSEMCRTTERSWAMKRKATPSSLLQVVEQVDDARLDRHVERRHGLVQDQQLRAAGPGRGRCPTLWRCPPENSLG